LPALVSEQLRDLVAGAGPTEMLRPVPSRDPRIGELLGGELQMQRRIRRLGVEPLAAGRR
jgi:hypothetical protein